LGVGGRVAAQGDADAGQGVDVGGVDGAPGGVGEDGSVGRRHPVEGPDDERCHLLAADEVRGAVLGVGGRVTAQCDPGFGDGVDVGLVDRVVVVVEAVGGAGGE